MVPYRLLSPFYKISREENFNKRMRELTNQDESAFYRFIEDGKVIEIGEQWYSYLYNNQVIINAWIEYSLVYFLQKKNPNVPAIPLKLTPPDKRSLGDIHEGKQKQLMNKLLEDYVHIMPSGYEDTYAWYQIGQDRFMDYLSNTIMPLYQIAYNQGYDIWECKGRVIYSDLSVQQEAQSYIAESVESIYGRELE